MSTSDRSQFSEAGWALVSVLWFVAMLALLAAATEELTLTSSRAEHRAWDRAQIDAALNAGVVQALLKVTGKDIAARWRVDGIPYNTDFNGVPLLISVQDESGRFDINTIDFSTIEALLKSAGVKDADLDDLADSILNWRGPADLHRVHGASDDDYASAGFDYLPRHGPFQSVDELRLVLGMTPSIFARIRPALTVYTRRTMIDANLAPRTALLVLYGGDTEKADEAIRARTNPESASSELELSKTPGYIDPNLPLAGHALSIDVTATAGKQHFIRHVVVELTGDSSRPYLTLAWQ